MFDLLVFALPLSLIILAIFLGVTFLAPSWRWVAGFVLVLAVVLALVWIEHWIDPSTPDYKEGPGGTLGLIILKIGTSAFAFAVVFYAAGLIWWNSKQQ